MTLLYRLILRPLWRDRLRTALTILSVALGIAVIVAIDLASDAATGSFQSSMETLTGKTDFQILANGGVDERWIGRLDGLPVDAHFAPVMETEATIAGIGSVPLYGLDFLGDERLLVSRALVRRLAAGAVTATVAGRRHTFTKRGTLDAPGEFLAIDIAAAQHLLERYGKLDRIDVTVSPGEDAARVEQAIRATLPPSYLIEKPGARNQENQRMLRAFRWNLRVLSYISLIVGAFLIYNTISVSVLRRRGEIGVLRALGAGRGAVLWLFLAEALMLGIAGGLIGLAAGRLLAAGAVRLIAGTVNALYTTSRPAPVALTWSEAWLGLVTAAAVALASAFGPARGAMEVAPAEAMSRGAHEHHARLHWPRALAFSAVLAAVALAVSRAAPIGGYPIGGYAAALLAVGVTALAAPAAVVAANRLTRSAVHMRLEGLLAARSLAGSLGRTSVIVAALATAIAMMASVATMVASFRETVALWLDVQLRADLYVRPAGPQTAGEYPPLAPQVPAILESTPGVAAVDVFRASEFHYRGERATLGAGNIEIVRRYGRLRFLPGEDRDAILRSLPGRDRAIVSEPFANKFGVRAGDVLTVPIGDRNVALRVAGIYYEYSSSQGYVIVDQSTLLKYLPNQPATNAAVYLAGGANADGVEHAIQLRLTGLGASVAPNRELRRNALAIFDRTFAITWALEAVAIIVAMLGAANALLALVLDRRREFGLLRYLGASAAQVRAMILVEAALLGSLAALLGLALGGALSLLLIFVVNKQSFGWTIQFHPPGGLLAAALLLVWCTTVLAALYPARVATRLNPIEVIREE